MADTVADTVADMTFSDGTQFFSGGISCGVRPNAAFLAAYDVQLLLLCAPRRRTWGPDCLAHQDEPIRLALPSCAALVRCPRAAVLPCAVALSAVCIAMLLFGFLSCVVTCGL